MSSPLIAPGELIGKTAAAIDNYARRIGLIPLGPNPAAGRGAYVDPVRGAQRILIHREQGHFHVNDALGERLDVNGNRVAAEEEAAHLALQRVDEE